LLGSNLLAVHVNYLAPGDAALLGERRVNVVHCPRSHMYFQHDPFPARELAQAGVNLSLGTDSLASVHHVRKQTIDLDMLAEMRTFAANGNGWPPEIILRMATINGARALGMAGKIGELCPGAFADLIAVPISRSEENLYEAVIQHRGDVAAAMIDGRWVWQTGLA